MACYFGFEKEYKSFFNPCLAWETVNCILCGDLSGTEILMSMSIRPSVTSNRISLLACVRRGSG